MLKKATQKEIEIIKKQFKKHYVGAVTELKYRNDFELLVSIILSAQCTDKRVNIITPKLFARYPTPLDMSKASLDEVKDIINSCSFFNNKAKNIIKMSKSVVEDYNGQIPNKVEYLIKLAGVGQKTANVFMIERYGANLMAVDTHVFRVSHRLGLSYAKSVKKCEEELVEVLKDDLDIYHQAMVLYGRYICKAVKPECQKCLFPDLCKTQEGFKPS